MLRIYKKTNKEYRKSDFPTFDYLSKKSGLARMIINMGRDEVLEWNTGISINKIGSNIEKGDYSYVAHYVKYNNLWERFLDDFLFSGFMIDSPIKIIGINKINTGENGNRFYQLKVISKFELKLPDNYDWVEKLKEVNIENVAKRISTLDIEKIIIFDDNFINLAEKFRNTIFRHLAVISLCNEKPDGDKRISSRFYQIKGFKTGKIIGFLIGVLHAFVDKSILFIFVTNNPIFKGIAKELENFRSVYLMKSYDEFYTGLDSVGITKNQLDEEHDEVNEFSCFENQPKKQDQKEKEIELDISIPQLFTRKYLRELPASELVEIYHYYYDSNRDYLINLLMMLLL